MTVDVCVSNYDDAFINGIEDIIEDTLVQMFVLHPKDLNELEEVQELSDEHNNIFYALPLELLDKACNKCVGVYISTIEELEGLEERVLMIEESNLNEEFYKALDNHKGIILNATKGHEELENFFVSISPGSVDLFDNDELNKLSMKKIVLQSGYPKHEFDDVYTCVEKISHAMFRSEQSITLEATKNTLQLFSLMG
ncbi:hypothetical protein [Sulfurimonas sp. C5]|uniref:hypothetical protein n=1 Tax=Sulfurimonas sp. C5 TaxID=3036947 RepID=UPI002457F6EF|nr:hypothetical protein [Sulfurimonas sp. C5]MDH4944494.1 hypothetical protein [Sulfurimonas sp. C5]